MTLFPEMFEPMYQSILGRAVKNNIITVNTVNIRDYAFNKHNKVDDYTYGGGAGMLMQAEPVYLCHKDVCEKTNAKRTVYLTPQGKVLNQEIAKDLALENDLILICGHYEGIDERVLEETVTDYISVGDYVLTGGELPAMILIDCVSRFVDGVLNNSESAGQDSFSDGLLEYPQYSRPEIWHDKKVPDVLLSGHHENVEKWRHEQSLIRTKERRPDLYEKYMENTGGNNEKKLKNKL